jgi:electron transfer flavoprotein beta subunit
MNIIVCVKQVVDPEAPTASFKVDEASNKMVTPPGVSQVIDPYGEYAVEAALKIKNGSADIKVTALVMGVSHARDVVKKPLSMGCDELVLLEDEAFADSDSFTTAATLAAAIKKIGEYDLVLCGREASDGNAGQVGAALATLLGLPSVTLVKSIEAGDGKAKVERMVADGVDVVETTLPALLTISNEIGEARYPTIKGIMAAKKKDPTVWSAADIGLDANQTGASGSRVKLQKLFQPVVESQVEIITGGTPEEAGANLAIKLSENKII